MFGRYKHRVVSNSLLYADAKGGQVVLVFYWKVNKFFPHINLLEKEGEKALLLSDHPSKLLS